MKYRISNFTRRILRINNLIILDRDGTLNIRNEDGYILKTQDLVIPFSLSDELSNALINNNFFNFSLVTNQSCINRGLIKIEDVLDISKKTLTTFLNSNDNFNYKIYICPHLPSEACRCRKPQTKLLEESISHFNSNLNRTWFIGDSESDRLAARALGIKFFQVCLKPKECSKIYCLHDPISALTRILNE